MIHWVYIVLSRVRSLISLVLNKKLDESRSYKPNSSVMRWERITKEEVEKRTFRERGNEDYRKYLIEEKAHCIMTIDEDESSDKELKKEERIKSEDEVNKEQVKKKTKVINVTIDTTQKKDQTSLLQIFSWNIMIDHLNLNTL